MADYHILTQDSHKTSVNVVFHIPIPAGGTNQAGISWRETIVKEQGGSVNINSVLPDIEAAELTSMKSGEVFEKQESVRFSSINLTPSERKAQIEGRFTTIKAVLINNKQIILEWMGYSADVT